MRARMTRPNQITIPDELALALHGVEYLDIEEKDGCLVLSPLRQSNLDDVYEKIERLGITKADIADAVAWARRGGGTVETGT